MLYCDFRRWRISSSVSETRVVNEARRTVFGTRCGSEFLRSSSRPRKDAVALIVKVCAFIDQFEFGAGEFCLSEDRSVTFTYPAERLTGGHLLIPARDPFPLCQERCRIWN